MFTRTGDDTDTVGNIEEFLQQCLEDMEPDDRFEGPGRPRILPRNGSVGWTAGLCLERL